MKFRAGFKVGVLLLLVTALTACNSSPLRRNSRLEDSLLYYKIQMGRSNYVEAARFRAPGSHWDIRGLERYKVSEYTVKQSASRDNGNTIERIVLLRYIDRNTMRERSTLYKEIWNYDTSTGHWSLSGEPPVIR